ncbi:hypothetical protein HMPREF7215_1282 [Pyramidobacter piscolens W5455]|uniref:Uncharacterized protein n=1 Tax=Pyramidobacter piscolens W5455 TaxID=352165 RepID=A0ABM9ZTG8_9BACT|nr:hypothetical protein HMPREF7215_1282 [Pyramidobacter piscolens W5455]
MNRGFQVEKQKIQIIHAKYIIVSRIIWLRPRGTKKAPPCSAF